MFLMFFNRGVQLYTAVKPWAVVSTSCLMFTLGNSKQESSSFSMINNIPWGKQMRRWWDRHRPQVFSDEQVMKRREWEWWTHDHTYCSAWQEVRVSLYSGDDLAQDDAVRKHIHLWWGKPHKTWRHDAVCEAQSHDLFLKYKGSP